MFKLGRFRGDGNDEDERCGITFDTLAYEVKVISSVQPPVLLCFEKALDVKKVCFDSHLL